MTIETRIEEYTNPDGSIYRIPVISVRGRGGRDYWYSGEDTDEAKRAFIEKMEPEDIRTEILDALDLWRDETEPSLYSLFMALNVEHDGQQVWAVMDEWVRELSHVAGLACRFADEVGR